MPEEGAQNFFRGSTAQNSEQPEPKAKIPLSNTLSPSHTRDEFDP